MLFINWKINIIRMYTKQVFPSDAEVMNLPVNAENIGHAGSVPRLGRSPGRGNGKSLQCPYQENSMNRRAWQATVHGVTKSQTLLSMHEYALYKALCRFNLIPTKSSTFFFGRGQK